MLVVLNLTIINYRPVTRVSQLDNFLLAESVHGSCEVFTLKPSYWSVYAKNPPKVSPCTSMSTCQWTCRGCSASTYTPLRTPLQAQRCSSCLLWGSGNVTAQNSVGVSSESNLWRSEVKKRENCWEKQSDKQVTRPICFVGGESQTSNNPLGERQ